MTIKINKIDNLDSALKYVAVLKAVLEACNEPYVSKVQSVIHFNHRGSKDG